MQFRQQEEGVPSFLNQMPISSIESQYSVFGSCPLELYFAEPSTVNVHLMGCGTTLLLLLLTSFTVWQEEPHMSGIATWALGTICFKKD